MKGPILIYALFILLIIIEIKADNIPQMNFVINGALNGTATFVSFENINENEKYLYFTFDFEFHSKSVPKSKNIAYFLISSEIDLVNENSNKEKIKYGFLDKSWNDNINGDDIKNIFWNQIKLLYKENPYTDINYYYEIKRKDDKMKTLVIRIPTNGNKEGSITVENIMALPDFTEKENVSDI